MHGTRRCKPRDDKAKARILAASGEEAALSAPGNWFSRIEENGCPAGTNRRDAPVRDMARGVQTCCPLCYVPFLTIRKRLGYRKNRCNLMAHFIAVATPTLLI